MTPKSALLCEEVKEIADPAIKYSLFHLFMSIKKVALTQLAENTKKL